MGRGAISRSPIAPRLPELGMSNAHHDHLEGLFGLLCFQAIVSADGQASVFEINGRFGGGAPLAIEAGAPLAKWLIQKSLGMPYDPRFVSDWQRDLMMLRYDQSVFARSVV
jgi:carbamoyl-phosphate synthase large subunit